ncbi:MAG: hypothetical protein ACLT8E_10500 [Akkermansia sp.]
MPPLNINAWPPTRRGGRQKAAGTSGPAGKVRAALAPPETAAQVVRLMDQEAVPCLVHIASSDSSVSNPGRLRDEDTFCKA